MASGSGLLEPVTVTTLLELVATPSNDRTERFNSWKRGHDHRCRSSPSRGVRCVMLSTVKRSASTNGGLRSIAASTRLKTAEELAMPSVSDTSAAAVSTGMRPRALTAYRRSAGTGTVVLLTVHPTE